MTDVTVLYNDLKSGEEIDAKDLSEGRYLFVDFDEFISRTPKSFKMEPIEDKLKKELIEEAGEFPIGKPESYLVKFDFIDSYLDIGLVQIQFDLERLKKLGIYGKFVPNLRTRRDCRMNPNYSMIGQKQFSWEGLKESIPEGVSFSTKFDSEFYDISVPDGEDLVSGNNRYAIVEVK